MAELTRDQEARNPNAHGAPMLGGENLAFQMPPAPAAAMAPFNFASVPASADPVVRYTVEQAMAQVRGADKKARHMLMIEATARQLAYQMCMYEDAVQEEQQQQHHHQQGVGPQGPPQNVMNDQDGP